MGKRLWMLCLGLVAMMTVLAMNLSAVDAKAVLQPPYPPNPAELTYLVGDYRIVAVYPEAAAGFIDKNDIGAVIRIGYDTNSGTSSYRNGKWFNTSSLYGMAIEASSNSRFSLGINDSYFECSKFFGLELPSQYCKNPNAIAEAELNYIKPSVQEGEYAGHVVIGYSSELVTDLVMNGNKIIFYHCKTNRPVFEMERIS
ncbi:hypothetical protein [Selenomonas ruminantium]|uniref:Uncharacterized protein n=1 Tax=Selenomonas ruminantium TaxID=971 RepID=A0A1K1QWG4_SELRU|nr:hypothetical protein [Selenomonas ruminantium]SFW63654.1 hypothetical protein SAMN02910323_0160 [Selenomonas ruminantium]